MNSLKIHIPGMTLVAVLALLSWALSRVIEVNVNLIAITVGFVVANSIKPARLNIQPGIKWSESKALAVAVALLGAQLNFNTLSQISSKSLVLIILGVSFTFIMALYIAKIIKVKKEEALLVASGQGICGSAAIMASQSILKAPSSHTAMIVALVNFLGFVGVFMTVWLAQWVFAEELQNTGLMIGNTLQSMGHVVAAGFSVNDDVGQVAVLIKMGRILLLIPVLLLLIFINKSSTNTQSKVHWLKLVPIFIWVFLLLSILSSFELIPEGLLPYLAQLSKLLFLLAMVAIGMGINVRNIINSGGRLLVLCSLVFFLQIVFSMIFLIYV